MGMKTINVLFVILSIEEGLHGIVSCTACGQQVNHFQKDSIYRHPTLKVLICKVCGKQFCLFLFHNVILVGLGGIFVGFLFIS